MDMDKSLKGNLGQLPSYLSCEIFVRIFFRSLRGRSIMNYLIYKLSSWAIWISYKLHSLQNICMNIFGSPRDNSITNASLIKYS